MEKPGVKKMGLLMIFFSNIEKPKIPLVLKKYINF